MKFIQELYTVVNAVNLCNGDLPDCRQYDLDLMRPHLVSTIENGEHKAKFLKIVFPDRELSSIKTAVPVFVIVVKEMTDHIWFNAKTKTSREAQL